MTPRVLRFCSELGKLFEGISGWIVVVDIGHLAVKKRMIFVTDIWVRDA